MGSACGLVVPSMNTLWYHYPQETRRALHGTPTDVQRKFAALDALGLVDEGMEMFLMPSRLAADPGFTPDFARRFSRLPFRTVHIGETEHDFLDAPGADSDLSRLAQVLEQLESPAIVLHAHHLEHNRPARANLLRARLPGTLVQVENNGFDHAWGARASSMASIFADCPDFAFCLDIVHVKDFQDQRLEDFLVDGLGERVREIHWACSTRFMDNDPYEVRGFHGYNPFHALFPLTDVVPSERTIALARRHPTVMEGVVPPEDPECLYLRRERDILCNGVEK